MGLFMQHVGKVRGDRVLRDAQMEAVGKTVAVETVQGLDAVLPIVGQLDATAAIHFETCTTRVSSADFEAGGEDDAVHFVFHAVEHQTLLSHAINALASGIHQRHVGSIERG